VSDLRGNVRKVYAIRFLYWFHTASAVLVPFFRDWGGVPLGGIFLLNAWFMGWSFALEVPTGGVADRFGRKASICLGCGVGALGVALYTSTPHLAAFLAAEVLLALSMALNSGADEALLYESLEDRDPVRARRAFARAESWKLAGIVGGALFGSVLASRTGLRATFAFQALPMALSALLALSLREPPPASGAGSARPRYGDVLREGLRHFAREPALRVLTLDMVSVGALVWLVIWLYQPLLESAGVPLVAFGPVHTAAALGQIAVLASADRLQAALGSQRALLFAAALAPGIAFVGLGLVRAPTAVIGLVLLAWTLGMARTPLFSAALNARIPSAQRATVLSVVSGLRRLGIVLANGLTSLVVGHSLRGTALAIGVAILGFAVAFRVREEHLGEVAGADSGGRA
jgi:Major Facilitator Superfamily